MTWSSFFNTSDDTFAANATGFAGSRMFQSAWCFTFRDWTEEPKRHWINAFVLGAEALALWMAKERVFEVNGSFSKESNFVSVPLRTHFGVDCVRFAGLISTRLCRESRVGECANVRGNRHRIRGDGNRRVLFSTQRRRGNAFSFRVGVVRDT